MFAIVEEFVWKIGKWLLAVAEMLCLFSQCFGAVLPQESHDDDTGFVTIDQMISNAEKNSQYSANPLYFSEHTHLVRRELDMVFSMEEIMEMDHWDRKKRTAAIRPNKKEKRWPNSTVTYEMEYGSFNPRDAHEITKAMNEISLYTCLQFKQDLGAENRVFLQRGYGGCYSRVGMVGGVQGLGLDIGCRYKQIIIHELLHAIGIHHEQTRPDRDDYVTIRFDRIYSHLAYNFRKHDEDYLNTFRLPYDYSSVMHYGKKAFSANGESTIIPKYPGFEDVIGTNPGLSLYDIRTLNNMYDCVPDSCNITDADCGRHGFVGKDCKCWCHGDSRHNPVEYCFEEDRKELGTLNYTYECRDWRSDCAEYVEQGYCKKSCVWMMFFCEKSCKMC